MSFQVEAEQDDANSDRTLQEISDKFETVVPTLGTELGAPVISIQTAEGSFVTMPGYEDYVSQNGGGFNDLIGNFASSMDS